MSLLTVVQDVCAVVGVQLPTSVFTNLPANRTMQEMLALANEMAQRIAYDTREWRMLKAQATFTGDGVSKAFTLPANFRRMLLVGNVWRSTSALQPMTFVPDIDTWNQRRALGYNSPFGEWTLLGNQMLFDDVMAAAAGSTPAVTATFPYLEKNCVVLASGGLGDRFLADGDTFRLDERLLKLGMTWQWKAQKGSPYAEDLSTYGEALVIASGADKPAPAIIGSLPKSAANVAYPFPTPTSADWQWPLR